MNARTLAFPDAEFERRLAAVRGEMDRRGLRTHVMHSPENIYYLTGFETAGIYMYQALIVPESGSPHLVVREYESSNVHYGSWVREFTTYQDVDDPADTTAKAIFDGGWASGKVGLEDDSWYLTSRVARRLRSLLHPLEVVDASGTVEKFRAVKSDAEIEYIRQACRVVEAAMTAALLQCHEGKTENDMAADAYRAMILAGGEYVSLPHFVSSGERTFLTHATWSQRRLRSGDLVFVELSGVVRRYAAALLRCAYISSQLPDKLATMNETALAGLEGALEVLRPGIEAGDVARHVSALFAKDGFLLRKRIGYSIGINFPPDWGEWQVLSLKETETRVLEPNMVFHIPSSVRIHDVAAVAVSETVRVTESGCEVLTNFPRAMTFVQ